MLRGWGFELRTLLFFFRVGNEERYLSCMPFVDLGSGGMVGSFTSFRHIH
jgi:hypothetical protein